MSENFTHTDLLIQYLDGELQGNELRALQDKIATDAQLGQELEQLRLAKAAVKTYGLKKNIAGIHTEMMKELEGAAVQRPSPVRRMLQYSSRIAAVLVLALGVTVLYQYFSATPEKLFQNNYETFQLHETRGNAGSSLLEEPYRKADAAAVMDQFSKLSAPQAEDYFLNGLAALRLNRSAAAVQSFLALQQKNNTNGTHFFEADTDYYLALAYLHNNQPAFALPLFEKIQADETHLYHRKVTGWFMRKLRRLAQ